MVCSQFGKGQKPKEQGKHTVQDVMANENSRDTRTTCGLNFDACDRNQGKVLFS